MGRHGAHTVQLLWEMKYEFPTLPFLSKVGIKFWPCPVFPLLSRSLSKSRALPSLEWSVSELARTQSRGGWFFGCLLQCQPQSPSPRASHQHRGQAHLSARSWHIELKVVFLFKVIFLIIILFPFGSTYHHYLILQQEFLECLPGLGWEHPSNRNQILPSWTLH